MTRILIFLSILSSTYIFSQENSTNHALLYNQTLFDSDTCCWRKISADKEYLDAANLIVLYLDKNKPSNKHSLHWHAGQMFAMAGSDKLAIKYFKKTYSVFYNWFGATDGRTWYYYAKSTVAFIEGDLDDLESIINHWAGKYPMDKNYIALLMLRTNWGKSYEMATSHKE